MHKLFLFRVNLSVTKWAAQAKWKKYNQNKHFSYSRIQKNANQSRKFSLLNINFAMFFILFSFYLRQKHSLTNLVIFGIVCICTFSCCLLFSSALSCWKLYFKKFYFFFLVQLLRAFFGARLFVVYFKIVKNNVVVVYLNVCVIKMKLWPWKVGFWISIV